MQQEVVYRKLIDEWFYTLELEKEKNLKEKEDRRTKEDAIATLAD